MTLTDLMRAPRVYEVAADPGELWCVAVSPDRKKLLLSIRKEVRIIDMPDFPAKDVRKK